MDVAELESWTELLDEAVGRSCRTELLHYWYPLVAADDSGGQDCWF